MHSFKFKSTIARSLVTDISILLARVAINQAKKRNISKIGVSGGVAYNEIIMQVIKSEIEKENLILLQHKNVPPGDAGISIGQLAIAGAKSILS